MLTNIYTKGRKNFLSLGIMLIIFAIALVLNSKTLYAADDYIYRFVYHTPEVAPHMQRITTGLIPYSMYNHYLHWNGRFVAHSIVQFFMQFESKTIFNIFNSFIYVALIFLIDRFAIKLSDKKHNVFILSLIFFFTWFYIPSFGQSVLWVSGAGNYIWMSIIYLGYILFNLKNPQFSFINATFMAVIGFLTGASNENSGPAAVLIVLLFMLKRYLEKRQLNWNSVVGVIFSGIGFIVMIMSPGSQQRGAMHRSILTVLINVYDILRTSVNEFGGAYLIFFSLLIIGYIYQKFSSDVLYCVLFFMIGHLAAIYIMAVSPEFPARTFFGGVMFLAIATFIMVYAIFSEMRLPILVVSVVMAGLFLLSFLPAYQDISSSYYQVSQQYKLIKASRLKLQKISDVPIMTPAKSKYNAYHETIGLVDQPTAWMNVWVSKFFVVDGISGHYQK